MEGDDLLDQALTGTVSEGSLRAFLDATNVKRRAGGEGEGLTHDFKSGLLLAPGQTQAREKEHRSLIRRDLVGFANAGGGVLIIGVREPKIPGEARKSPVDIDGVPLPATAVHDYLKQVMNPILFQIYDYPVASAVELASGEVVWLLAIQRHAGALLYLTHDKKTVFPMRIGDNTVDLHHHLVTDLLVGRRSMPTFSVEYNIAYRRTSGGGSLPCLQWQCLPRITNTSMTYADDVVVSVVARHDGLNPQFPMTSGRAPDRNVLTKPIADRIDATGKCTVAFQRFASIATFDIAQGRMAPASVDVNTSRVRAALAVSCRNGPLFLYQLDFDVPRTDLGDHDHGLQDLVAAPSRRPVVDTEAVHSIYTRSRG